MSERQNLQGFLPGFFMMIIWGSMGIFSKSALAAFGSMTVLCLRSGIGAAVLLPFALKAGFWPDKKEFVRILLLAFLGVVLCNYFYFTAVKLTSLTMVSIIYALGPIVTAALAAVILSEKMHQSRVLGALLALIGVVALLTNGSSLQEISFGKGELSELVSIICLAVFTIYSKHITKTNASCRVFWMMLFSFIVTLPMSLIMDGGIPASVEPFSWISILYLGVMCSGCGYLLQQKSISLVGAAASSAFLNGISPITIITAAIFLHEQISLFQAGCIVVILAGVYLNAVNRTFSLQRR